MPRHSNNPELASAAKSFRTAININTNPSFEFTTYFGALRSDVALFLERFVQNKGPILVQPTYQLIVRNPKNNAQLENMHTIFPHYFEVDETMDVGIIENQMSPDMDLDVAYFEQSGLIVDLRPEDSDEVYVTFDVGPRQLQTKANSTQRGSSGQKDDEPDEPQEQKRKPGRPKLAVGTKSFFKAIYLAVHDMRSMGSAKLRGAWLNELRDIHGVNIDETVTQTNCIDWFKEFKWLWPDYQFNIYTKSGALIYVKRGLSEECTYNRDLCYDSTAKMWRYVYDPDRYFIGKFGPQCSKCFNRHLGTCESDWIKASREDTLPDIKEIQDYRLEGRFENVVYADCEVMINDENKHILTHIGLFNPNDKKIHFITSDNNVDGVQTPLAMIRSFVNKVKSIIKYDKPLAVYRQAECVDCNFKKGFDKEVSDDVDALRMMKEDAEEFEAEVDERGLIINEPKSRPTGYMHAPYYLWKDMIFCAKHIRKRGPDVKVYFHNLSGYDMHHLVAPLTELKERQTNRDINLRSHAWDGEKYVIPDKPGPDFVISKGIQRWERFDYEINGLQIEFKDSFKLLTGGLDSLIKDHLKEHKHMNFARKYEQFQGKLTFPYDWYNNTDKLKQKRLPTNESDWYNKLTDKILDQEPAHKAFDELKCKNVGEYLKHYLAMDVLGLADVVEGFRNECMNAFKVDPSFFHGTPSMAYWNAKARIYDEGNKDYFNPTTFSLQSLFYKNIRGGVTNAIKMYTPYIEPGEAAYVDVAGLYATAMRDYKMPVDGHRARRVNINTTLSDYLHTQDEDFNAKKTIKFFWIEFDYEGNPDLHDRDWQLPFIERREPGGGLINDFTNSAQLYHEARAYFIHVTCGIPIAHYDSSAIEFNQEYVFKEFVQDNLRLRQDAITKGQKTLSLLYKLNNNASYGKTMENPEKYRELVIDTTCRAVRGQFATMELGDNTAYVMTRQAEDSGGNTPHMGFTILEYSKIIFYGMWKKVHEQYGDNIRLLYCDTDSMILYMPGEKDLWARLVKDFGNVFNGDPTRKILGTWEKELNANITGVIALSAKQYFIRTDNDKEYVEKHKGVSKRVKLDWGDYESTYLDRATKYVEQVQFKRVDFNIITSTINKIGLSAQNRKRVLVDTEEGLTIPLGYKGEKFQEILQF